jgi:hypothetical protein
VHGAEKRQYGRGIGDQRKLGQSGCVQVRDCSSGRQPSKQRQGKERQQPELAEGLCVSQNDDVSHRQGAADRLGIRTESGGPRKIAVAAAG